MGLKAELGELRREVNGRPLVLAAISLGFALSTAFVPWHIVFCLLILAVCSTWRNAGLVVGAAVLGVLLKVDASPARIVEKQAFKATADVISVPIRSGEDEVVLVRGGGYVLQMTLPRDSAIGMGDRLEILGEARPLSGPEYRMHGMGGYLKPIKVRTLRQGWPMWKAAAEMRRSFDRYADQNSPPQVSAMLSALCFSMTEEMSPEMIQSLRQSGTSHIAATSGMHVVIVAAALFFALSAVPIPRSAKLILVAGALLVYAGAAGLRPSIMRSVLMMLVLAAAPYLDRDRDWLTALAAAVILYLLWIRDGILDVGFLLSVVAVAALAMYAPQVSEPPKDLGPRILFWVKTTVLASLAVELAVMPITAKVFGQVSIVSLAANLLILPLVMPVTVAALLGWMAALVWPVVGRGVAAAAVNPLTGSILAVVSGLGGLGWAAVAVPDFSAYWIPALYLCAFVAWSPRVRPA